MLSWNRDGAKTKVYVYSGGARIATQDFVWFFEHGSIGSDESGNRRGNHYRCERNLREAARARSFGARIGAAPDPTIAVDPLASSKWNDPMPIEYSPQWSGEMERGMRDYLRDLLRQLRDTSNRDKREFLYALFDLARTGNNVLQQVLKVLKRIPTSL